MLNEYDIKELLNLLGHYINDKKKMLKILASIILPIEEIDLSFISLSFLFSFVFIKKVFSNVSNIVFEL